MILEVHLHDLIAESEHDSMPCSHPFLDVNKVLNLLWWRVLSSRNGDRHFLLAGLVSTFEVRSEMLQKGYLFLHFFRIVSQSVLLSYVLSILSVSTFHVVESAAIWVKHNLGGVVEENTSRFIGKVVAKPIFA
jgi:hypothetical protein